MKNLKLTLLCFLFLNASCAQKDNSIVSPSEENYEIINVYKDVDIPWSIEFLDENTIMYAEKKGEIYIVNNNDAVKVENVPQVYFRGQGGLLDLELHPDYKNNNLIYMSYSSGSRDQGGGNTAIARAKLIDYTLTEIEVLYKGEENSTKGQHYGSRLQFDKDGFLYFTIGDRGNRDKNPQNLELDGGKVYRIYDEIIRSAITLKLLTYEKTGAVLAAATTSIPETIGEVRNWDYRFCWIRDSSMVIKVVAKLGHKKIVKDYIKYILNLIPEKNEKLQIMYGINGEKNLTEKTLDYLKGYMGSKPVRIGNAAYIQKQNDMYGILMDAIHFQIIKFNNDEELTQKSDHADFIYQMCIFFFY